MISRLIKRLLKHLTWFDLAILTIGLSLLMGIFLLFRRKNEFVKIRVKVTDPDPLYEWNYPNYRYASRFKVGDIDKDTLGNVAAEIVDIERFDSEAEIQIVYLDLNILATYDSRKKQFYFRGRPLIYGSNIDLQFSNALLKSIVIKDPDSFRKVDKYSFIKAKVVVRAFKEEMKRERDDKIAQTVEPETIYKLIKGEKITNLNGTPLAEIVDSKITPALRIVETVNGRVFLQRDPYYKDAELTIKFRVKENNGKLFVLDGIPVRSGLYLTLPFDNVIVKGTVLDLLQ